MHYAVSRQTAAEIIYNRADSKKENMGLTSWKKNPNGKIMESDVVIAKNIKIDITKINDIPYLLNEVEMQSKKLMKTHNDSVDYLTIIYLLKI